MELKQYRKCNGCKALTYQINSNMGRCELKYKTISTSIIYDTKPLELCPKPKTNEKYFEWLNQNFDMKGKNNMTIECIKKYIGNLITIQKGERFFVENENEEKYCVEISDGAIGWFPKENFKII